MNALPYNTGNLFVVSGASVILTPGSCVSPMLGGLNKPVARPTASPIPPAITLPITVANKPPPNAVAIAVAIYVNTAIMQLP